MQYRALLRIVGLLVTLFSATMLPPMIISLIYQDGGGSAFFLGFVAALLSGCLLWLPNYRSRAELKARDGFLIVVLFWTALGTAGALPFMLSSAPEISIADAFFESFSGLTTTGATVLTGLDDLPKAILFYRQQLQWLGGIGIIVLAVAVLPLLGIGGMQLYRAEIPGPVKDTKMTPRIADTAKRLWYLYVAITAACALSFYFVGMSGFDAICHAFSTVAIGGFSTHDASIGYFNSPAINGVCVVFMLIAGMNFTLHYAALATGNIKIYTRDTEVRTFLAIQLMLTLVCTAVLVGHGVYRSGWEAFDQALFQAVSISTTAGFSTTNFVDWPLFLPILLLFASFIGGCAGSTGGGIKVIRIRLLLMQGLREVKRLIHPKAIYSINLQRRAVPNHIVEAVWGFFATYALVFVVIMLALIATGMEEITAFSATAASLNNLGPGLGEVATHYGAIADSSKWILVVSMLFGRLEIFTLLVLFMPEFWRD